ncbi:MAG: GSCFA domain-containing protein [Bacteroidales bacterium]|nr:GSCFA domain-containing protein [Bacteroidales bacterium]
MEFRTRVEILQSLFSIGYTSKCLFVGSCFADNIGLMMQRLKFSVMHNPFGVLYNPLSVKECIQILIERKVFTEKDILCYNNNWLSFYHYTAYTDADKAKCLEKINHSTAIAGEFFSKTDYLFITFGTAWVYEYLKTGQVVANCHKIPAREFHRYMLSPEQITIEYATLLKRLQGHNPHLKVIFTVSPIRHWKDGAVNNQLSKSVLHLAIQQLIDNFDFVSYFPAYEIFMDELRDYRFYAKDMLHPSEAAIDYTWQRFTDTYFTARTVADMKNIEKLMKAMEHRVVNHSSGESKKFRNTMLQQIEKLKAKFPSVDFSVEKDYFLNL